MSFQSNDPRFSAEPSHGQSPPVKRGPEMYQLDPLYEVQDQPSCEIGDLPPSIGDDRSPPAAGNPPRAGAASAGHATR